MHCFQHRRYSRLQCAEPGAMKSSWRTARCCSPTSQMACQHPREPPASSSSLPHPFSAPRRVVSVAASLDNGGPDSAKDSKYLAQRRLEQLDEEFQDVKSQLKDARAALHKNPGDKLLWEDVQYLKGQEADLNERRKALEAKLLGSDELLARDKELKELRAQVNLPAWQRLAIRHTRPAGAGSVALTADEVMDIVASGENSLAEFKEVKTKGVQSDKFTLPRDEIARQACAFANSSQGGTLLYGIQDKPRRVVGVDPKQVDGFVRHVTNALQNHATPPITFSISTVEVNSFEGKPVRVVAVDIPPARDLTSAGEPRTVYKRVGDSSLKVEGVALEDLRQRWFAARARVDAGDTFPVEGAYLSSFLDVLKLSSFGIDTDPADKEMLHQRLCRTQLAKDLGGPEPVLTVAGLLLLGPSRTWQEELPLCNSFLIKILVYNGDDPSGTSAPYEQLIMGDAQTQIDQATAIIDAITALEYEIGASSDLQSALFAPRGVQRRRYPLVAVRELLVNALVHRSYNMARGGQVTVNVRHQSLEIQSPGALPPGLTPTSLGSESAFSLPRNPILSWYMHRLTDRVRGGRVFEGHGQGIARARRLIQSYGGSLTYKQLPLGAVVAVVTAGKSPVINKEEQ